MSAAAVCVSHLRGQIKVLRDRAGGRRVRSTSVVAHARISSAREREESAKNFSDAKSCPLVYCRTREAVVPSDTYKRSRAGDNTQQRQLAVVRSNDNHANGCHLREVSRDKPQRCGQGQQRQCGSARATARKCGTGSRHKYWVLVRLQSRVSRQGSRKRRHRGVDRDASRRWTSFLFQLCPDKPRLFSPRSRSPWCRGAT